MDPTASSSSKVSPSIRDKAGSSKSDVTPRTLEIKIPLLGPESFSKWYKKLCFALKSVRLYRFIDGTIDLSKPENQAKYDVEMARVAGLIYESLDDENCAAVDDTDVPAEMIERLRIKHVGSDVVKITQLLNEFHGIKFDGSVRSLYNKIRSLNHQLTQYNQGYNDLTLISKFMMVLPDEFNNYKQAVRVCQSMGGKATYADLEREIVNIEPEKCDMSSSASLMNAATTTSKKKFEIKCYHCGGKGHKKSQCRKWLREKKRSTAEVAGGINNQQLHVSTKDGKLTLNVLALVKNKVPDIDEMKELLSLTNIEFYIDSGASFHIVNNRQLLFDYVEKESTIRVGNNSLGKIEGVGKLKCEFFNGSVWYEVTLNNVHYLPTCPINLLSHGQITNPQMNIGWTEKTVNGVITYFYHGEPRLIGIPSPKLENMYRLIIRVPQSMVCNINNLSLWHERFVHINKQKLQRMINEKLVDGLPTKVNDDLSFCIPCHQGKMVESSHQLSDRNPHILPGQKLHLDVCGYASASIHQNRYFLCCIDEKSSFIKVSFMKDRTDVLNKFKRIVNEFRIETGNTLRAIRSDRGSEFTSNEFAKFTKENGINHEFACVGIPQQNGFVERNIRTIVNHSISILNASGLPLTLWDEAINHTVYVFNRTVNCRNVIPYEVLNNKRANVSNLRIFGSKGEMMIPQSRKFGPKTKTVHLVGYIGNSIYRCYDPISCHVEQSSNVVFDEEPKCSKTKSIPVTIDVDSDYDSKSNDDQVDDIEQLNDEDLIKNVAVRRGRPLGSRNHQYKVDLERLKTLRHKKMLTIVAAGCAPSNYEEAVTSEESSRWIESMKEEYKNLISNETWKLVPRPTDQPVISTKWVFTIKDDGTYKSRLVARGFQQKIENDDSYAPVVSIELIRTFFSIAASRSMSVVQFDCVAAFLNGTITEDVYIEQPEGFTDESSKVCKLLKSIYGLRNSPKAWNNSLDDMLLSYGLKALTIDPCFYYLNNSDVFVMLVIYVDDCILASTSKEYNQNFLKYLSSKIKIKIVERGIFLGIRYRFRDKQVFLDQEQFTLHKLEVFGMAECKGVATPINHDLDLLDETSEPNENYPYRQSIGNLLYLAVKTRPDIMYAVSKLASFCNKPLNVHVSAIKRVWRYLKSTHDYGIWLGAKTLELVGHSDADLGGSKFRRTTTAHIISWGGPIIWKSKEQKCIIDSTAEAEYVAASNCSKDIRYILNVLEELAPSLVKLPIKVFIDNQATIKQIDGPAITPRLRHISLKYHIIRQLVKDKIIDVLWTCSSHQKGDFLTKPLPIKTFEFLRDFNGINRFK